MLCERLAQRTERATSRAAAASRGGSCAARSRRCQPAANDPAVERSLLLGLSFTLAVSAVPVNRASWSAALEQPVGEVLVSPGARAVPPSIQHSRRVALDRKSLEKRCCKHEALNPATSAGTQAPCPARAPSPWPSCPGGASRSSCEESRARWWVNRPYTKSEESDRDGESKTHSNESPSAASYASSETE